ncbi:MAG: sialidase family protein [Verrucomicrobia bacterium]|nr:sialidase family protein [Verrucomicrobiota bacterium]
MKRKLFFNGTWPALVATTFAALAFPISAAPSETAVFVSGKDGYHTYRIPSVVVTVKGTVLAFCEGRKNSRSDTGDIDLVMKRSSDGGKSWGSMSVVWDDGPNTCGNPCPVVDRDTGTIHLLLTWNSGKVRESNIKSGFGEESRRVFVSSSTDDGNTWTKPKEITAATKKKDWTWYATGPGAGIQLEKGKNAGRLVIPCDHKVEVDGDRSFRSHAIYSDDHGKTWQLGGIAPKAMVNECEVVELLNGRLLLNMRNYDQSIRARQVCFSEDGGLTWQDQRHDKTLIEPTCQASIRRLRWPAKESPGVILFSNPGSTNKRDKLTIRASYDDGATWKHSRVLYPGGSAYSCLAVLKNQEIGNLYEKDGYKRIVFVRFDLDWVENGTSRNNNPMARGYTIPTLDLSAQTHRQVVVDRETGQYLGHPTTVLLEDGKTMLIVYPKGHGKGGIAYKRSSNGGKTWSDRLPTPKNWATSREVPTIHRVVDAQGKKRLIMWSGLYPARLAVSENDGANWSQLKQVGDWGGIVVMGCLEKLETGKGNYMAMFHDDGRFFTEQPMRQNPVMFTLYKTFSKDGGLTWSNPENILARTDVHLCEPGIIRSPDGKQLAVLLRENSRRRNSYVIFSNDEGNTWTNPRELPASLTGDRHTGKYTADGRLFISFRDTTHDTPTKGDWVAWVGTYEDIVKGNEGQYRVRLMDNTNRWDCAYPPVEVLPDNTIVTTTYGHWAKGEKPYIVCVHLKLSELDAMAKRKDFLK